MSKGFVKVWRSERDIPALWENACLFCVYHKLKILAQRPGWELVLPRRKLAKEMALSATTLSRALAELARMGLVRLGDESAVSRVELVHGDEEPFWTDMGAKHAKAESQACSAAPQKAMPAPDLWSVSSAEQTGPAVSNFGTQEQEAVPNFDTKSVPKFGTPLISKQEVTTNKKTTPPLLSPQDPQGTFAQFWAEYPNKKSKQRAQKKWKQGGYALEEILPRLRQQKKLRNWVKLDGQFIPRADAYLNQRRWEDELPDGEEFYVLDFLQPKTDREKTLRNWLEATNPELLKNSNPKINSAFEPDRVQFERLVVACGGDVQKAFAVMRHGWRMGCSTLRAIAERVAAYLDELRKEDRR